MAVDGKPSTLRSCFPGLQFARLEVVPGSRPIGSFLFVAVPYLRSFPTTLDYYVCCVNIAPFAPLRAPYSPALSLFIVHGLRLLVLVHTPTSFPGISDGTPS